MINPTRDYLWIEHFASVCEELNEFVLHLREIAAFRTVRTGADIRRYHSGWRLEKWIEAELDREENLWAVWWLELGPHPDGWLVRSHVGISPDALHVPIREVAGTTSKDLGACLSSIAVLLKNALTENSEFAEQVKRAHKLL